MHRCDNYPRCKNWIKEKGGNQEYICDECRYREQKILGIIYKSKETKKDNNNG